MRGEKPLLRKVAASYGSKIVFENSLGEALNAVFGVEGSDTTTPPTEPPDDTTEPPATGEAALKQAITDAQKAYTAGEAALKENDWAAYGKAQADLEDALRRAAAAQPKPGSGADKPAGGADKADPADKADEKGNDQGS